MKKGRMHSSSCDENRVESKKKKKKSNGCNWNGRNQHHLVNQITQDDESESADTNDKEILSITTLRRLKEEFFIFQR